MLNNVKIKVFQQKLTQQNLSYFLLFNKKIPIVARRTYLTY